MAGGRINIYLNQDGTNVNKKGEQFLDSPLTKSRNFLKGWKKNGENTGKDLQLNSGGTEVEDVETY